MFQIVNNWSNRRVEKEVSLEELHNFVKNPNKEHIQKVLKLRSLERGSEEFNKIKASLPCYSVAFNFRGYINKSNATTPTGYLYIDVDNVDTLNLEHSSIAFYCKSVSGKGYSIIVGVKGVTKDNIKQATIQVAQELDIQLDLRAISTDRLTVISYDINSEYNPNHTFIEINNDSIYPHTSNYTNNKYIVTDSSGGKLKTNNIDDICRTIDFDGELLKDFKDDKIGIVNLKTPYKTVEEGSRNSVLNSLCYTLRGLNMDAPKEIIYKYLQSVNINKFRPQLTEEEVLAVVDSVYRLERIDLKPNEFRRFLYNPDYNLTTTEKRSNSLKQINKVKSEKVFAELENIIDNWDVSLGKITQTKLAEVSKKNIKTVEKHYKNLKEKVKNFNKKLQDKK